MPLRPQNYGSTPRYGTIEIQKRVTFGNATRSTSPPPSFDLLVLAYFTDDVMNLILKEGRSARRFQSDPNYSLSFSYVPHRMQSTPTLTVHKGLEKYSSPTNCILSSLLDCIYDLCLSSISNDQLLFKPPPSNSKSMYVWPTLNPRDPTFS